MKNDWSIDMYDLFCLHKENHVLCGAFCSLKWTKNNYQMSQFVLVQFSIKSEVRNWLNFSFILKDPFATLLLFKKYIDYFCKGWVCVKLNLIQSKFTWNIKSKSNMNKFYSF